MALDVRKFFQATNPSRTLAVENEEDRKYYIDFSSVRGGRIIEELKENIALWLPDEPTCDLFTGHIGCGKSTELLRLKADLEKEGFHVVYFESSEDLEMGNVDVGDILLAIARRVSESLEEIGISFKSGYFQNLFNEVKEVLQTPIELSTLSTDVTFSVGIASITAQAKASPKQREKLQGFLEPRTNGIIDAINQELLEPAISKLKHQGKNGLVVIVDNLDRVDSSQKPWGRLQPEYLFVDRG
ncbi:MAG: AAA family ATPase, partial [Leptolyngbyaceae cyanobacterium MO_188.B28]|nr:AAA family ATPase [Leptolyngbyaceae cyanobacterium MO_188.B28]